MTETEIICELVDLFNQWENGTKNRTRILKELDELGWKITNHFDEDIPEYICSLYDNFYNEVYYVCN